MNVWHQGLRTTRLVQLVLGQTGMASASTAALPCPKMVPCRSNLIRISHYHPVGTRNDPTGGSHSLRGCHRAQCSTRCGGCRGTRGGTVYGTGNMSIPQLPRSNDNSGDKRIKLLKNRV